MWALQYFDLAQRALRLVELRGVGLQNAVNDKSDRAFSVTRAVNAADVDLCITGFGGSRYDCYAGCKLGKSLRIVCTGFRKRFGINNGYRCRDVHEPFILSTRGYDDFFSFNALFGRLCERRGRN